MENPNVSIMVVSFHVHIALSVRLSVVHFSSFCSFCLLLLPFLGSVIVLCFVLRYFMIILVLQSS